MSPMGIKLLTGVLWVLKGLTGAGVQKKQNWCIKGSKSFIEAHWDSLWLNGAHAKNYHNKKEFCRRGNYLKKVTHEVRMDGADFAWIWHGVSVDCADACGLGRFRMDCADC